MLDKPKDDRPMTTGEVSDYLRYRKETVIRLANDGVLPGRKVGKEWRFDSARIKSLGQVEKK